MKPTEIDLTSVISKKFLMPESMFIAYLERINLAILVVSRDNWRWVVERTIS